MAFRSITDKNASFGIIDQTPDKFVAGMEGSGVKVAVARVGEPFEV